MKIHLEIPLGYQRYELLNWLKKHPDAIDDAAVSDAVKAWVQDKWGKWFSKMEISDYDIYEVTPTYFRIDFLHDSDAAAFDKAFGSVSLGE